MIDFSKPVQTRDGRKVEILATDLSGDYSVAGVITSTGKTRLLYLWTSDGALCKGGAPHPHDLVNAPERVTRYLNVYRLNGQGSRGYAGEFFCTREEADYHADYHGDNGRVCCQEITFED